MKILLDECMPVRLPEGSLAEHDVQHVRDMNWLTIQNGELLQLADQEFDVLVTIDKNMPFQQSLKGKRICVAVLDLKDPNTSTFRRYAEALAAQIHGLEPGSFNVIKLDD